MRVSLIPSDEDWQTLRMWLDTLEPHEAFGHCGDIRTHDPHPELVEARGCGHYDAECPGTPREIFEGEEEEQ